MELRQDTDYFYLGSRSRIVYHILRLWIRSSMIHTDDLLTRGAAVFFTAGSS